MAWTVTTGIVDTAELVPEGTPAAFGVEFKDELGVAYVPASTIAVKVYDGAGTLLETATPITAAAAIDVKTAAATNELSTASVERRIFLEWTAITTLWPAPGVPQRCQLKYKVQDLAEPTA